ncbi:MAG TPA: hypothetical protein VIL99_07200 [Ignavibacteria bacterium]
MNNGICAFCKKEIQKELILKHFSMCDKLLESINKKKVEDSKTFNHFLLYVEDTYNPDFWLYLEMINSASFKELDKYLRAIWLECCGHLSHFAIGTNEYNSPQVKMSTRVYDVLPNESVLTYVYDYGTSSILKIKVKSKREGVPLTKHPITLFARNVLPDFKCVKCGDLAKYYCVECNAEDGNEGYICEKHKEHSHDDYGEPIEIINSPRLGMCGYDGPAKPPY